MDQAGPDPQLCRHCQKLAAFACGDCKDVPPYEKNQGFEKTWYCSTECQKLDSARHEAYCKVLNMRKELFRVGSLVQELFYVYRKHLFDIKVEAIAKEGSTMRIHEGEYSQTILRLHGVESFQDLLFPFPSASVTEIQDQQALLTHLMCDDSIGWMHGVLKYCVGGKDLTIFSLTCHVTLLTQTSDLLRSASEIVVIPKNVRRQLITIGLDGTRDDWIYSHMLLQVELTGGEEYAIDLAGAQHGYYEPITPWNVYEDTRVSSIKGSTGSWGAKHRTLLQESDRKWLNLLVGRFSAFSRSFW